jgi:hypothetical protein
MSNFFSSSSSLIVRFGFIDRIIAFCHVLLFSSSLGIAGQIDGPSFASIPFRRLFVARVSRISLFLAFTFFYLDLFVLRTLIRNFALLLGDLPFIHTLKIEITGVRRREIEWQWDRSRN